MAKAKTGLTPNEVFQQSLVDLRNGHWKEGWQRYESRFDIYNLAPEYITNLAPKWDGKSQGRLLVWAEQGLGDTLFFSRWIPKAKDRCGGNLNILDRMCMLRMWDVCPHVNIVYDRGYLSASQLGKFDYQISLVSLPHVLGIPVIKEADAGFQDMMLPRYMKEAPVKKVGICWAGSPSNPNDNRRSMELKDLTPILLRDDIACVSLQMASWHPYQTRDSEKGLLNRLTRITENIIDDVYDMASIIQQLDVVVTVDTMVAHLAGILGIPTLMLANDDGDWRWGWEKDGNNGNGEETQWYKTMRIFRRGEGECWKRVVGEVNGQI